MLYPEKVNTIIQKIQEEHPDVEFSIKCRLGVNNFQDYEFFDNFIQKSTKDTNIRTIFVHARNAILEPGFSTKDNRKIPPLRYYHVIQAAKQYPQFDIILNGGITSIDDLNCLLHKDNNLSGVMIGRWAYENNPLCVEQWDKGNIIIA